MIDDDACIACSRRAGCSPPCRARCAQDKFITVASTTSTEQSGLFGTCCRAFEKETGIKVRVVALGTGQALDLARRGDADVVFVHDAGGRGEIRRRGPRRQALAGHVQRLRADRAEARSREGRRRQGHPRGAEEDRRRRRRRSSRAATRAARTRPSSRSGRTAGVDLDAKKGPWYRDTGLRHGTDAQHRVVDERLRADRSRHVARRSRTAAISRSWSKATSACSTSTA